MNPERPDMMAVTAARALVGHRTCFVGIGAPSTAANLARITVNRDLVLIYESGCIGAKPSRLPLSIGDGDLADTADTVVSMAEIFFYWLQAGRIDIGFLGAAQIDRYANLNSTVIGPYSNPSTRLPGAGGAPEIAAACGEVFVMMRHGKRAFVEQLDFRTTVGHGNGPGDRGRLGMRGRGPTLVITDLGVLRPHPVSCELTLTDVHPGVTVQEVLDSTGWPLRVADTVNTTPPATEAELISLRKLESLSGVGGGRQ